MRYGSRITILSTVLMAVFVLAASSYAQVSPPVRDKILREARELVKMGNRKAAIQRVEALYNQAPLDGAVVQSLASLLAESGDLERAKSVLTDYTSERGDDTKALSALASLQFRTGENAKAMAILDALVARAPNELWPYYAGLDVLTQNSMNEEVITHIRRARRALGDSALFAVEAAKVHREMTRFGQATREYLLAGTAKNMSAEIAADYIIGMARDDEARPAVIAALEKASSLPPFARAVSLSLGEVYLMDGDCGRALEMISRLVDADPSNADALIMFAQKASASGCFTECARAYDLVLGGLDKEQKKAEYLVAKARCEERAGMFDSALSTFDTVARDYGTFKYADEALMGRAEIFRSMGEIDRAIAEAGRVMGSGYSENVLAAILFQGDCYILLDRLDDAFQTYDRVTTD